jgi:hypothetical protein
MKAIPSPRRNALYPDRDIDCQQAIEAAFQELVENAVAAGWRPIEVSEAVGQLAIADRWCRDAKALVEAYNMLDQVVHDHSA